MNDSQGWVKMHRSLLEWEWYQDINTKCLFLHLLIKANHKDKKHQGTTIKRGQLVTGLSVLSSETSLSVQRVRTSLNKLKSTNEITSETSSKGTLISIVNYDLYQSNEEEQQANQQTSNKRATNKQQTNNKRTTTNKNDKNIKNDKNERMKEVFTGAEAKKELEENDHFLEQTLDDFDSEKEKSSAKKEKVFGKPEFKKALLDEGVLEQHVDDWIKVRTAKRASFTQTVIDSLIKECNDNSYSVADAVRVSAEQSWQGFKFSWVKNLDNYGKQETRNTNSQSRQDRVDEVAKFRIDNQQSLAERLQKHITSDK